MPNDRNQIASAYTEDEAKDEVIAAARAFVAGEVSFCDDDDCECCSRAEFGDLSTALSTLDTYKGVR